jgi:hypothetical protein
MKCTLWNWSEKCHLRRLKRGQPAPVDADMWVYRGTVYSTKGTTWSGSPLQKEAQQEVRQHCFIDSYIAAYVYKGAVQGCWSTPNWSDRRQGFKQVSTVPCFPPTQYLWALEPGFQCERELFFLRALFLLRARDRESANKAPAPISAG